MTDQRRTWHRLTAPIWRRIRLLISRGVLKLIDDGKMLQEVQVTLLGGEPAYAERFQQYGFTGHPHPGAEAVVAAVSGARAHLVAFAIDDRRYRLKGLAPGEVAIYDDLGNMVVLHRDRIKITAVTHLEVAAPTCEITATTTHIGDVTINGNLVVNGNIDATGDITDGVGSMQGMRDTYNGHDHPGDSGGTTGNPNQEM